MQKVARNGKSPFNCQKVQKSCRATCGKTYIISINKTVTKIQRK